VKTWLQLAGVGIALTLAASAAVAWRAVRRERAELQQKLSAAEKELKEAEARQESRRAELDAALAKLEFKKRAVQTPRQVVQSLSTVLPLPEPVALQDEAAAPEQQERAGKGAALGTLEPKVTLPTADLKPLYDFAVGCQECQTRLQAAEADLKDEQAKTAVLGRERDTALRAARGGSALKRLARAAKWFVIGAAAGAAAAKLAH